MADCDEEAATAATTMIKSSVGDVAIDQMNSELCAPPVRFGQKLLMLLLPLRARVANMTRRADCDARMTTMDLPGEVVGRVLVVRSAECRVSQRRRCSGVGRQASTATMNGGEVDEAAS